MGKSDLYKLAPAFEWLTNTRLMTKWVPSMKHLDKEWVCLEGTMQVSG